MRRLLIINFSIDKAGESFTAAGIANDVEVTMVKFKDISVIEDTVYSNGVEVSDYDVVLIGPVGDNMPVANYLESYLGKKHIPFLYYGCTLEIWNKVNELRRYIENEIPHIPTMVIKSFGGKHREVANGWGSSIVVKPLDGSRGRDVCKYESVSELLEIFANQEQPLLVQPFVPNDGDFRIIVLRGRIIGCMKRTPPENDFRANVSTGGTAVAYEMTQDMIDLSQKVIKAFPEDFLGIDLIRHLETDELYVMEVNHAPQFQGFMHATGIDMYDLVVKECLSLS